MSYVTNRINELCNCHFKVFEDDGETKKTGQADDCIDALWYEDEVSTVPVTIVEVGTSGEYLATFTPDELGKWELEVLDSTGRVWGVTVDVKTVDVDVGSVADAVWNEILGEHSIDGSTGKALEMLTTLGSGSITITIKTLTEGTEEVIPNAQVKVFSASDTDYSNALALGYSGTDEGEVVFNFNPGSYNIIRTMTGYSFPIQNIVVTNLVGQIFTGHGIHYEPTVPSGPDVCMVYGYIRDITDVAVNDPTLSVYLFSKENFFTKEGEEVLPYPISADIDENGFWEIPLIPNSLLTPSNSRYVFCFTWREEADNPRIYDFEGKVVVPNEASVDFSTLKLLTK